MLLLEPSLLLYEIIDMLYAVFPLFVGPWGFSMKHPSASSLMYLNLRMGDECI